MQIIHSVAELRARLAAAPRPALVPTMGGLHEGHLSLVRLARTLGRTVVATIFVNRLQFAPTDDFERYPRTLAVDGGLLEAEGCDVLFAPSEEEMYPEVQGCLLHPPPELADILEGRFRPGFFIGVCTVVLKLFNMVQPDCAVFGKKDYQQWLVIRNMVRQLALPIEVIGAETVRHSDGLAMSSRNAYLSPVERMQAAQLQAVLRRAVDALRSGSRDCAELEQEAHDALRDQGWKPDYVAIRMQHALRKFRPGGAGVVLAAARLGSTRLIDNIEFA